MADDIDITPGTGASVRTIDKGDAKGERQVVIVEAGGAKTQSTAAPTTTPGSVLAANDDRQSCTIHNAGSQAVEVGTSSVTYGTGLPLEPGQTLTDDSSTDAWWAVAASGTGDLRIIEVA